MLTTTFKLLRVHDACTDRYAVLRKSLRGRRDNEPIGIVEVLDHNGLDDALWALRAVPDEQAAERDKLARLYACWCVRQVLHLLTDERSRVAVETAERFAVGEATWDELDAAYSAAASYYSAAYSAAAAAYSASYAAAVAYSASYAAAAAYATDADAAVRDAQEAKFREMFG
jgi:hypothetical protein